MSRFAKTAGGRGYLWGYWLDLGGWRVMKRHEEACSAYFH